MHDTTDPLAEYPADVRFVNQGPDRRIPGELGVRLARFQRVNAFKSADPPDRTVTGSEADGYLWEESYSRPGRKPFLGFAVKLWNRWHTIRLGYRWDPNWGDAGLRDGAYNPLPSVIGGYFPDILLKFSQRVPHIEVP
jgi:hypothetical protein